VVGSAGSGFFLGVFCGTARLRGGESSGDQWSCDSGGCGFLLLGGRCFFRRVSNSFWGLWSPAGLGILTLVSALILSFEGNSKRI